MSIRRQYGRPTGLHVNGRARRMQINTSVLSARRQFAAGLGNQYDGRRDVYESAGYPKVLNFDYFLGKYLRQDVAQRIVHAAPEETWRRPPIIYDNRPDDQDAAAAELTEFSKAVSDLTDIERIPDSLEQRTPNLWSALAQADKLAGIGEYGVLVLGIKDGGSLDQPLTKGNGRGSKALLYLTPLRQDQATIASWERDVQSPRYGRPILYRCTFSTEGQVNQAVTQDVHWTRVIHIAEDAGGTGVFGLPRLQAIYNLLEDLLKVMAGAGEAAWRLLYKGLVASTRDGYGLNDSDTEMEDKVEEYIHDYKRFLLLEGMDIKIEGGEIVDPTGLVKIILMLISAATGIPQRILTGSERGELASTQDEGAWKESISARQVQFAEPFVLRELINRLIFAGILPEPENRRYTVEWPSLFEPTEQERTTMNGQRATIIAQLSPPGAPDAYVEENEVRQLAGFPPRERNPAVATLDDEDGQDDQEGDDE